MKDRSNQKISVLFMLYGILFCVCLITANVLETKQISFGPANMTAGLIVFPVSYIINDVVCEVWGYGTGSQGLHTGMGKRVSIRSSDWLRVLRGHRSWPLSAGRL